MTPKKTKESSIRISPLLLTLLGFLIVAGTTLVTVAVVVAKKPSTDDVRRMVRDYAAPKTLVIVTRERQKSIYRRLKKIDKNIEKLLKGRIRNEYIRLTPQR